MRATIGIIGGMGPAATALLFQKIVKYTDAENDADHIHILIDNNPAIPDRTSAILNHNDEPVDYICQSGEKLVDVGADFLVIPCNTSHYFYDKVSARLKVPVLNMIDLTAKECRKRGYSKVGILATTGTCKTGIFNSYLTKYEIEYLYPDSSFQNILMDIIYKQVKAGKKIQLDSVIPHLMRMQKMDVDAFVLGCTELPLAFQNIMDKFIFIDTVEVLAKSAIEIAGYSIRK